MIDIPEELQSKLIKKNVIKVTDVNIEKDVDWGKFISYRFEGLGAKNRRFSNCDFSFSIFQDGYFRNAKFINCKFIGVKFIGCNFKTTVFENCSFSYSQFDRTQIDVVQVLNNLPSEPNICRDLLREHKVNAESVGDIESSKVYTVEEMHAARRHWEYAALKKSGYYSTHYPGIRNWFRIRWNQFQLWLDWHIWGYGEVPIKLCISSLIYVVVIAITYSISHVSATTTVNELVHLFEETFWQFGYGFIGGEIIAVPMFFQILIAVGHLIFLGLFINILFSRISKR